MLLKSDRAAGEEKQWGCVIIMFFCVCALWLCIYMCEWSEYGLNVCVCVCSFLASMCIVALLFQRGYYAFYVIGLAVSYFHI